jgi:transposase-like protein
VVDAYFSQRRNAKAAETFFRRAINETGITPARVVTDKATCYPPALHAVLPNTEHRRSTYLNNGLERDHQPGTLWVKQRVYPMRGFKQAVSADSMARGHAFIQNLRNGCSRLSAHIPCQLRLMAAWSQLAQAI